MPHRQRLSQLTTFGLVGKFNSPIIRRKVGLPGGGGSVSTAETKVLNMIDWWITENRFLATDRAEPDRRTQLGIRGSPLGRALESPGPPGSDCDMARHAFML